MSREFHYKENVCWNGLKTLVYATLTWLSLLAFVFAFGNLPKIMPQIFRNPPNDSWPGLGFYVAFIVISTGVYGIAVYISFAFIRAGGFYRVQIKKGILTVSSPTDGFGVSFEIGIDTISKLLVVYRRHIETIGREYLIEDVDGRQYQLSLNSNLDVSELFSCIQSLNPSVVIEELDETQPGRKPKNEHVT